MNKVSTTARPPARRTNLCAASEKSPHRKAIPLLPSRPLLRARPSEIEAEGALLCAGKTGI